MKICHSLLEKINSDLDLVSDHRLLAQTLTLYQQTRTDEMMDVKYLINTDYSSDLAINTMGRRIRTRLYFTSESHLHTVLNVLRFASDETQRSILSPHGCEIINSTPGKEYTPGSDLCSSIDPCLQNCAT